MFTVVALVSPALGGNTLSLGTWTAPYRGGHATTRQSASVSGGASTGINKMPRINATRGIGEIHVAAQTRYLDPHGADAAGYYPFGYERTHVVTSTRSDTIPVNWSSSSAVNARSLTSPIVLDHGVHLYLRASD